MLALLHFNGSNVHDCDAGQLDGQADEEYEQGHFNLPCEPEFIEDQKVAEGEGVHDYVC